MPTIMQNLVVFIEPSQIAYDISSKGGYMCMNRFCIDENAAFELSGVRNFDPWIYFWPLKKGKEFSTRNGICVFEASFV